MDEPDPKGPEQVSSNVTPRIVVVGSAGSGKTRLAKELARRFQLPHIELDGLNWDPEWTAIAQTNPEAFKERVSAAVDGGAWVVDGNYGAVRNLVWPKATALVWLDYPLRVVLWRVFWRTLRRTITRQTLWNGNRERFATQFLSRDSLFLWVLKTYRRRRREYPGILGQPEHAHLRVFRHRSPRETRAWLAGVTAQDLAAVDAPVR